jgi:hypothetical protein
VVTEARNTIAPQQYNSGAKCCSSSFLMQIRQQVFTAELDAVKMLGPKLLSLFCRRTVGHPEGCTRQRPRNPRWLADQAGR